ncbi:sporulation/spore germination protein [Leptolyngbya sp. FACHB-16]|uniref:sporulation/spore germination protein n=1 Tax=unclassified Leptolyngbya TaxID=2650499 RepID=UPI0016881061|nr:sporulation/spore germination protein [Leptolyngbya sp. FACHB-16]MBD2157352.1 sporulation/spore germination protein [Leptolyngbya sp. FACHB-16]
MNRINYKSLSALMVALSLCISLASCRNNTAETPRTGSPTDNLTLAPNGSRSASPSPNAPGSAASPAASPGSSSETPATGQSTNSANSVTVTVYKSDDQCVNFEPQQVQVAGDRPLEGAVGKVLENQGSGDFDLSGYRVTVDPNTRVATVDLRMNPNSQRKLVSLSACEQFALFGSLRETLVKNPDWNITDVRFTERGEEIAL